MSFFLSLRNRSIIVTSITLALLSVILAYYSLGMNVVGHEIPLTYTGDGLFISALIKGLVDNSWIFENNIITIYLLKVNRICVNVTYNCAFFYIF